MSTLEDVRYALRTLCNQPLYAFVTVLVLALALGANTTVFSVFNGFFMRPLPYVDGDRSDRRVRAPTAGCKDRSGR